MWLRRPFVLPLKSSPRPNGRAKLHGTRHGGRLSNPRLPCRFPESSVSNHLLRHDPRCGTLVENPLRFVATARDLCGSGARVCGRRRHFVPYHGRTTGFTVNYTPDSAARFDLDGDPVERLQHIDLAAGKVRQDAREVRTKFSKTFRPSFAGWRRHSSHLRRLGKSSSKPLA